MRFSVNQGKISNIRQMVKKSYSRYSWISDIQKLDCKSNLVTYWCQVGWPFSYLLMGLVSVFRAFHLKCPLGKLHLKNSSIYSKLSQIIFCCPSQSQLKTSVTFPFTWVLEEAALCYSLLFKFLWLNKCPVCNRFFFGYVKNKATARAMAQCRAPRFGS